MYKEQQLVSDIRKCCGNNLTILSAFFAIAEERSFTKAAKRPGASPSGMSHAIRGLEEDIGVRLLSRTTRSVAPKEAGEQLVARLRLALRDAQDAVDQLSGLRDKPAGRVRLLVPRFAGNTVLGPKLAKFTGDYPDVVLDITADESRLDIVAGDCDAGMHFGEYIQKDMIAVHASKDHRAAIVGAASYFKGRPTPRMPHDLLQHRCINFRHGSLGVYRWKFYASVHSNTGCPQVNSSEFSSHRVKACAARGCATS